MNPPDPAAARHDAVSYDSVEDLVDVAAPFLLEEPAMPVRSRSPAPQAEQASAVLLRAPTYARRMTVTWDA